MENPPDIVVPPKPSRRLLRWSVRASMLAVLVLAVVLGWVVNRARVRREAVAAIRRSGGGIAYDFQRPVGKPPNNAAEPNAPRWLVARLGVDYFADVVMVMVGKQATDADLAHLAGLPRVRSVNASMVPGITDAGTAHLAGLRELETVNFSGTKATGATLAHFRGMTRLKFISLIGQGVADADLAHLEGLTGLESLYLSQNPVTDAGLAHLDGLVRLKKLWLTSTPILGPGLVHLKGMTQLDELNLNQSRVRDLASLPPLPALKSLRLDRTAVGDAEVADLARLAPALTTLDLDQSRVTDAAIPGLLGLARLESLGLEGTPVTDATLDRLHALKGLRFLNVTNTAATDAGIARLRQALPAAKMPGDPALRPTRPAAKRRQPPPQSGP